MKVQYCTGLWIYEIEEGRDVQLATPQVWQDKKARFR